MRGGEHFKTLLGGGGLQVLPLQNKVGGGRTSLIGPLVAIIGRF